jgi:hypothetical protein
MRENLTAWDNDPKWQCLAAVVAIVAISRLEKKGIAVTLVIYLRKL